MRGVVNCLACGWWQSWVASGKGADRGIYNSKCRRCGKRNRFTPGATYRRGMPKCVNFLMRPDHMPRRALERECRARRAFEKEERTSSAYHPYWEGDVRRNEAIAEYAYPILEPVFRRAGSRSRSSPGARTRRPPG